MLNLMEAELALRASPMPELISFLEGRMSGSAKTFLAHLTAGLPLLGEQEFAFQWRQAVENHCGSLRDREKEELNKLGSYLGRFELEAQTRELRASERYLRERLAEAEQTFPQERKLWLGLSVSAGVVLTVLVL